MTIGIDWGPGAQHGDWRLDVREHYWPIVHGESEQLREIIRRLGYVWLECSRRRFRVTRLRVTPEEAREIRRYLTDELGVSPQSAAGELTYRGYPLVERPAGGA